MKYSVDYTRKAEKQISKMDKPTQERIYSWIGEHLEGCENPRQYGKSLSGDRKGEWSYRVGDYRIIADIQDDKIIILITRAGHRREIYRSE